MTLAVSFDEKRWGYWVKSKFGEFFAYFTGHGVDPGSWIEFDIETWDGEPIDLHFQIPIGTASRPSNDLIETMISNELRKFGMEP